MDILKGFLQSEINSEEFYTEIVNFITSYEIRRGEFEGNEFIIHKMSRDNFILYPEYPDGEDEIQIPYSLAIYKENLLDAIKECASEKGLI